MRVFGIDCGTEFTGYGVVEVDCSQRTPRLRHLCAGAVRLNKKDHTPVRLAQVYAELTALMTLWEPACVAIEDVFFANNAKSALKLGQVRGVAMLAAKDQVGFMVARLLELKEIPKPADATDALAIAICHIHHAQTAEVLKR